jgi:ketosteroid isomerase-like protein
MEATKRRRAAVEESAEIKSRVIAYYDALQRCDLAFLEQFLSKEECLVAIGTQPDEWYSGRDALLKKYKVELESTGGAGFTLTPSGVMAYSEGSVGWAVDRPTVRMSNGSGVTTRFTFLFHREDGQWKLVQGHMSVGIPDEQLMEQEPSTDE